MSLLPPFPGTSDEAARVLPLLRAVYDGRDGRYTMTTEYDGTYHDYPTVRPVVQWFVRCVIMDNATGADLVELTEAQAQWAAQWFAEQPPPQGAAHILPPS